MVTKTDNTKKVPATVGPSPSQDAMHVACQAHTLASYLYNQMALAHPWAVSPNPPMGMGPGWNNPQPGQPWHVGPSQPFYGGYPLEAWHGIPFRPDPFGFFPR